jgi:Ca2+-binding RTX toxin-like protein
LVILGDGDAETMRGTSVNDDLLGNDGDDSLEGGAGADDLFGSAGSDTASYANALGGVVANLTDIGTNTGDAAGDTYSSIENLSGSAFADTLIGKSGDNILSGRVGDDGIFGLGGSDDLLGNDGNDTLIGGAGADNLGGGSGIDAASYETATAGVVANLTAPGGNTGEAAGDTYGSIEFLIGSAFVDTLTGTNGANTIIGRAGDDTLSGLGGSDDLFGNDGNDILIGGAGADDLFGGSGSDTASYANAAAGVTASLTNQGANTGDAAGDTYSSIENLTGSAFADALTGSTGANVIIGGNGGDTLNGRQGSDTLTGGGGNDNFRFDTALGAGNVDTITDFNFVNDTIVLDNAIFNAIVGVGVMSAAQFRANTTGQAGDANDRIIYETDTGNLFYDTNGNTAGGSTLFAVLNPGLGITNADFFIA